RRGRKILMRHHLRIQAALLVATALAAAACESPPPSVTVGDRTLTYVEQSYGGGLGSNYCDTLDVRGQYEVIITDFALCDTLKPMSDNRTIFHSSDETNLRLIFSAAADALKKVPPTTVFTVGTTKGCTARGPQAAAF